MTPISHCEQFASSQCIAMSLSSPRKEKIILWILIVMQLPFSTSAFVNFSPRSVISTTSRTPLSRGTLLLANNATNIVPEPDSLIQDSFLLVGDIVSIALASQLLGLVDVLNDASFWERGGWFQPISPTESTSTLPTLVQRDSMLTICWLLSALGCDSYKFDDSDNNDTILSTTVRIAVGFCALRLALGFAMSLASHDDFDAWESIRQCYFTIILVGSFRFLYLQYTR